MAADAAPSFVYLPQWRPQDERVDIAGDEAHYLARVVRARVGEHVTVTDGRGSLGTLEIVEIGAGIRARRIAHEQRTRAATLELWCGAPEGDRGDWLVEKLAELGVAALVPVQCRRTRWERFEARRERWERLATAALRQSCSAFRLEVRAPVPLAEALATAGETAARWVCLQDGQPAGGRVLAPEGRTLGVVGPSSGFNDEELNLLSARGFTGVCLADTRLRAETAALALGALWVAAAAGSARTAGAGEPGGGGGALP